MVWQAADRSATGIAALAHLGEPVTMSTISMCNLTLEQAMQDCVDGVFVIDKDRRIILYSRGCERLTGTSRAKVLGSPCACHNLTDCRDKHGRALSGVLCPAIAVMNGERSSACQRMTIDHADGHRVWIGTTYSPVRDEHGVITGAVGVMRDITEIVEREAERAEQDAMDAGIDPVPGSGSLGPLDQELTALERRQILAALRVSGGQRTEAAKRLGISRSRLYRRMAALGIGRQSADERVAV